MPVATVGEAVAEFTGTFLLVFCIGCNVMCQTGVWAGVSIACVLMVVIYCFGKISGGNFNPAVSFALGLLQQLGGDTGMTWKKVGLYSFVQLLAGACAGLSYRGLFGDSFPLRPAPGFGTSSAGVCEFWYTFMLCFVVLNVAVAKGKQENNKYYGLAIGFVIVAGAYGAGAVSGGCFNPAVAFGIAVGSLRAASFPWFVTYTIFEIIGAAVAVFLYRMVRPAGVEKPDTGAKLLSEFLGTFMLVLTVGLNVIAKSPAGAFSIAASLMCMIYALGDVSGAHFNPAVSLAIFCSHLPAADLSFKEFGQYMLAQIGGGICGAYTYAFIHYGESFPIGPGEGYSWSQAFVAEITFTALLCLVVLCLAVSKTTNNPTMFGLAIGSCVTVGGFAIGNISGGSLNPAVSMGISGAHILNGGFFFKSLFYSLMEFIGAAFATGVVNFTHCASDVKLCSHDAEA